MDRKQRVFWADGGTLRDVSNDLNDFRRGTLTFDALTNEYLYVASELPFNHKYFDLGVVNALASVVTVQTWDGSAWRSAVDVVDETSVGGKTFAQSGVISFAVDIDVSAWGAHRDSNTIAALVGTRVFGCYWARFKFSASLTNTTTLKYIGQRFCDDDDLDDFYPDLRSQALKTAFESSAKTTWNAQCLAAAQALVADLRAKAIVVRRDQVFDTSLFQMAAVHKTAAIIYGGLKGFGERAKEANEAYASSISLNSFEIDVDGSGEVSDAEKRTETRFFTR